MDDDLDYIIPRMAMSVGDVTNNGMQSDSNMMHQMLPSSAITNGYINNNDDVANCNHHLETLLTPPSCGAGFLLQLSFNGQQHREPVQMASHAVEEEARRCQEQLDGVRQSVRRFEAEMAQLERDNDLLRAESELRELMAYEQGIQRLEDELAKCCMLATQSTEELVRKMAAAKATRTKRFETECALRELQLGICRRKLEYATAKALDQDVDDASEEDPAAIPNLPEEEERVMALQRELDELTQLNNRYLGEVAEAELLDATRQSDLVRIRMDFEQRISAGRGELDARRQNVASKRQTLEQNVAYLNNLGQQKAREKLKEVELHQRFVLVEAARKLEQLERTAFGLLAANTSPSSSNLS